MISLSIPLRLSSSGLSRCPDARESITSFLKLLIYTSLDECPADREFGFLFNNLKFENFDENNGIVLGQTGKFGKKISGISRNLNTFASELCEAVKHYEHRLSDVTASMSYVRTDRLIYLTIKGIIKETGEDYQFATTIKVWK